MSSGDCVRQVENKAQDDVDIQRGTPDTTYQTNVFPSI